MAGSLLKRREAMIWLPPRAIGERAFGSDPVLQIAERLPASGAAAAAPGLRRASLDSLPPLDRVTLVFDARDVNLLRVTLPPLSRARMRQAIPNLVEESLLQDVQQCVCAIGPRLETGQRLVAVTDRAWLEFVLGAFTRRGIRVQAAWPAQLVLPLVPDAIVLACGSDALTVRTGPHDGFGWSAGDTKATRTEALVQALGVAASGSMAPARVAVFAADESWREPLALAVAQKGFAIDDQPPGHLVAAPVDLLSARAGSAAQRWFSAVDWRAWRWPAGAVAAAAVVALAGLNLHAIMLAREGVQLQAQIEDRYRQAFPGVSVLVDPVLQMRRSVAQLQAAAGRAGAGDFLPLLARFATALGAGAADAVTAVEYRAGRLRVRFAGGRFAESSAREALVRSMRQSGLMLSFEQGDDAAGVASRDTAAATGARAGTGHAWSALVALQP